MPIKDVHISERNQYEKGILCRKRRRVKFADAFLPPDSRGIPGTAGKPEEERKQVCKSFRIDFSDGIGYNGVSRIP
ncbi:MAG: hypothetical protein IKE30_02030 [Clostridia bacterium]|nr:hypothetical protein [Clostridia bacterium]